MIKQNIQKEIANKYIDNIISQKELADEYKIDRNTVHRILKNCGVLRNISLDKSEIIKMYSKGLSAPKIAKKLGVSYFPIYDILRKENLVRSYSQSHLGQPAWNKGKKWNDEVRRKISKSRIGKFNGEKNPNWRGGKKHNSHPARNKMMYKLWEEKVIRKFGSVCQLCGSKERIEVHHIKPLRELKESEWYDENNGLPLCHQCHKKTYYREKYFEILWKNNHYLALYKSGELLETLLLEIAKTISSQAGQECPEGSTTNRIPREP